MGFDEDPYAKLLERINGILDIVVKDIGGAPAQSAATKPSVKVEMTMLTDSTNNICGITHSNTSFVIFDADNKEYTFKSPLMIYNDYLDVTKYGSKDLEILENINRMILNKEQVIKPYITAQAALPDNENTKIIKDALTLCKEFYDEILLKTTLGNIKDAKEHISKLFKVEEGNKLARKALENIYSTALVKATEAHNMFISATEDYFNQYIVYDNGQATRQRDDKKTKMNKQRTGAIVTVDKFNAAIAKVKTYIMNPDELPASIKSYDSTRVSTDFNGVSSIVNQRYERKSTFEETITPQSDISGFFNDISDISGIYSTHMPQLNQKIQELKGLTASLTGLYKSWNDINEPFEIQYTHATPEIQAGIKADYLSNKPKLDAIKTTYTAAEVPIIADIKFLESLKQKIEELYDIDLLRRGLDTKTELYQTTVQRQQDISDVNVIVTEWGSLKDHADVSMGQVLPSTATTKAAYDILYRDYNVITTTFTKVMAAKDRFDLATTRVDLSKNKVEIEKYADVSAARTAFNTSYGAYYGSSKTAVVLTQGAPLYNTQQKITYMKTYITNLLIDISNAGIPFPNIQATIQTYLSMSRIGTLGTINIIRNDISDGTILTAGYAIVDNLLATISNKSQKTILEAYKNTAVGPNSKSKLANQIEAFIGANSLPVMVGGGGRRVTRRRLTGSKRRKTYVRRAKNGRHQ